MGLANFNSSTSQIYNYSTSMTLILLPPYLKTIIKYQIDHSIQYTSYDSFLLYPTWMLIILGPIL